MTAQLLQDPTVDSVGKLLREAREALGLSLEDVAKTLCINKRQLGKFESDHESLICDVYNLGFLKSYAKLLNLNAEDLLQQFKGQNIPSPSVQLVFPTPLSKRGMPSFRILTLSLLALVSIVIGYEWVRTYRPFSSYREMPFVAYTPSKEGHKVEQSSPLLEKTVTLSPQESARGLESSSVSEEPVQATLQTENLPIMIPEEAPSPSPPPSSSLADQAIPLSSQPILLKVTEESWIEVKDDQGHTIVARLFHPNETYEFTNSQTFLLKTGNARGVHLISGEKELAFPGNQGEVKSGISLNPDTWID